MALLLLTVAIKVDANDKCNRDLRIASGSNHSGLLSLIIQIAQARLFLRVNYLSHAQVYLFYTVCYSVIGFLHLFSKPPPYY